MIPSLLPLSLLVISSLPTISQATGINACSSGYYQELLFLSNYAPAESYCSSHYPLPVVTVTTTAGKAENHPRLVTTTATTKTSTSRTSSTSSATKATGSDPIWSSLLSSAQSIVATVCSCIETPLTKTITLSPSTTKTSTKSSRTTSTSSKSTTTTKSTATKSTTTKSTTTKSTTTKSTTTQSTTTTTTSSRITPTATNCNLGGVQPTFLLQASAPGRIDDDRYALQSNTGGNDVVTFVPEISDGATTFSFDDACHLLGFGTPGVIEIANIDTGATNDTVFFNTADQIAQQPSPGATAATCNIVNGVLQCADQTTTILFVCTNQLQLQIGATIPPDHPIAGPAGSTSGPCELITLTPIFQ